MREYLTTERIDHTKRLVVERTKYFGQIYDVFNLTEASSQSERCIQCGDPFCLNKCPLHNYIPQWLKSVAEKDLEFAFKLSNEPSPFPEVMGRVCPHDRLCEGDCTLTDGHGAITIGSIETHITEAGFKAGFKPEFPGVTTDKKVAVIGSGPAGLSVATYLLRSGISVTMYESADRAGGLLTYGIPNFKLEKGIIDRRIDILEREGITFKTNVHVGVNYSVKNLKNKFDAVVLCGGATQKRGLPINGADSAGVVQAMDFLTQQTKVVLGKKVENQIMATDKDVIVIGGGDIGSDCIGTSNRHGAKSVTNFEIMPKPPGHRSESTPWPFWPLQLKTSSSHKEGCDRNWLINTKEFITNEKGELTALKTINVEWKLVPGQRTELIEIEGSEKIWPCDLALLALGFTGPESTISEQLGLETDFRSNYKATTKEYQTNVPHIFTAGDMRRGQSLIVWAISEGREAARKVDEYLMGYSNLPTKGNGDLPPL